MSNIATFHLYGRPGQEGILQYVEVYSPDTGDVRPWQIYDFGVCVQNRISLAGYAIGALPSRSLRVRVLFGLVHVWNRIT